MTEKVVGNGESSIMRNNIFYIPYLVLLG